MGERGHGRKLGEGGRAKVLELVVAGRSNSQINRILVEEGILVAGDSLSGQTFAEIRAMPEAKTDVAYLTAEAVRVGSIAVSEMLLADVEMWHAAYKELAAPGALQSLGASKIIALTHLMEKTSTKIINTFAPNLPDRILAEFERLRSESKANQAAADMYQQALANVIRNMTRYLNGELDRETAMARMMEFSEDPPTDIVIKSVDSSCLP